MTQTNIIINGAGGRMGLCLLKAIKIYNDLSLSLALEHPKHKHIGQSLDVLLRLHQVHQDTYFKDKTLIALDNLSAINGLSKPESPTAKGAPASNIPAFSSPADDSPTDNSSTDDSPAKSAPTAKGAPTDSSPTIPTENGVVIDFSTPESSLAVLPFCKAHCLNLVIGTTGFQAEQLKEIDSYAKHIGIIQSGNMSLGVHLLAHLATQAAKTLQESDIEITDKHHRHKQDAPSGTALLLGKACVKGQGGNEEAIETRQGNERRQGKEIGFSVIRAGEEIGTHQILFATEGESLTLSHQAHNRLIFAKGALEAARFLARKKAGFYDMKMVLGLS